MPKPTTETAPPERPLKRPSYKGGTPQVGPLPLKPLNPSPQIPPFEASGPSLPAGEAGPSAILDVEPTPNGLPKGHEVYAGSTTADAGALVADLFSGARPHEEVGFLWPDGKAKIGADGELRQPLRSRVSVKVSTLTQPELFDAVAAAFPDSDVYFTMNTFGRTGTPRKGQTQPYPLISAWNAESICAIRIDVDGYMEGLTVERVEAEINTAVEDEDLPAFSWHLKSGRGLQLLLKTIDSTTGLAPRADATNQKAIDAIREEIGTRINQIIGDDIFDWNAPGLTGALPLPGTKKTRGGRVVGAHPNYLVGTRKKPEYTIRGLLELLKLPVPSKLLTPAERLLLRHQREERIFKPKEERNPAMVAAGRAGKRAMNSRRARDLITICEYRGGFHPGARHSALLFFACALRGCGCSKDETTNAVDRLARMSHYREQSAAELTDYVYRKPSELKFSNKKICGALGITTIIADKLELETLRPKPRPKEKKYSRTEWRDMRREFLRDRLKETAPQIPTITELLKIYGRARLKASAMTVSNDLRALGVAPAGIGRPRKAMQPALFPDPKSEGFTSLAVLPENK